jgi:hypothetical protein
MKLLNISINEFAHMIITTVIIIAITMIIAYPYIKLMGNKKLFNKLSNAFNLKGTKKMTNSEIVEEVVQFRQLQLTNLSNDLPDKIRSFIQTNSSDFRVFIHFTSDRSVAEQIIKEGFKYTDSFYKTTQEIFRDINDLDYKLQLYRQYGDFLIIINIPKELFDFTQKENELIKHDSLVDSAISLYNSNDDLVFKLSSIFIKGYIDFNSNSIIKNNGFLKGFNIIDFQDQIKERLDK